MSTSKTSVDENSVKSTPEVAQDVPNKETGVLEDIQGCVIRSDVTLNLDAAREGYAATQVHLHTSLSAAETISARRKMQLHMTRDADVS